MAKMRTIYRVGHKSKPYSMLSNAMLRDRRLSIGARGALALILSHPEHWQFSMPWLAKEAGVGRDRAYGIVQELERFGYCWRDRARSADGTLEAVVYLFTDEPEGAREQASPLPEKPEVVKTAKKTAKPQQNKAREQGSPLPEKPLPGFPHAILKNEKSKIKTAPLPPAPRVKPASGQGFKKGSEGDELIDIARRAEGLGIDADGLIVETEGANSHRAAFLAACHREISDRLPGIHRDVVGRALIGDAKAYSKLVQLVSTVELRP